MANFCNVFTTLGFVLGKSIMACEPTPGPESMPAVPGSFGNCVGALKGVTLIPAICGTVLPAIGAATWLS
jgi:hypothetical protein